MMRALLVQFRAVATAVWFRVRWRASAGVEGCGAALGWAGSEGLSGAAGAGLGCGRGVGLGDEFDVEDEVGFGGDDGRAAGFAVGELVGDEEAALAADVHALKAGVPAGDDLTGCRRGR